MTTDTTDALPDLEPVLDAIVGPLHWVHAAGCPCPPGTEQPTDTLCERSREAAIAVRARRVENLRLLLTQVGHTAWAQGRESVGVDFLRPAGPNGHRTSSPNPYDSPAPTTR